MTRALLLALLATGCAAPGPTLAPFPPDAAAITDDRLIALYEAFRAGDDLPTEGLYVTDGAVRIEATAADGDGAALAVALGRLGLAGADAVGVVVNGMLPVSSLPQAAALEELRALRAVTPPPRTPPTPPERL